MPGSEYYDRDETPEELEYTRKERLRKQRSLESALYDVRKLSCWSPTKTWTIGDIRCVDLFLAIEDRIKSQLYDLGATN